MSIIPCSYLSHLIGVILFRRSIVWILSAFLLLGCQNSSEEPVGDKETVVRVETLTLEPQYWQHEVIGHGVIKPSEEYEISLDISATVKTVHFDQGGSVEVGDVLLDLDTSRFELQLASAEASVEDAAAQLKQVEATYQRNQSVYDSGAISEQQFRQSEANLQSARARLAKAQSMAAIARRNVARGSVKSPVSGTVSNRRVEPGQTVNPAQTLGIISGTSQFRIEAYVSHKDISLVQKGANAKIRTQSLQGQQFDGTVSAISHVAQPETGNFKVFVNLNNTIGVLREGMAAKVAIASRSQEKRLAVPRSAVVDRQRQLVVYRLAGQVVEAATPQLEAGDNTRYLVKAGLAPGDQIVVNDLRLISDGQTVATQ